MSPPLQSTTKPPARNVLCACVFVFGELKKRFCTGAHGEMIGLLTAVSDHSDVLFHFGHYALCYITHVFRSIIVHNGRSSYYSRSTYLDRDTDLDLSRIEVDARCTGSYSDATGLGGSLVQARSRSSAYQLEEHSQQGLVKDGTHLGGSRSGSSK